jgi:hypothetical protein
LLIKFLMVQKPALNFRFLWLKNKAEINLFENLHSLKLRRLDLISWLDFLLDNLFLCFAHGVYRQCIGIPMGTNWANFYLFTYEFDFIKCLLKSNTCPVVLHRFVDDPFVPDFPDVENFMYLDQSTFGSGIYPKTSCELNCMSKGFSCNFLDLAVRQSPQGYPMTFLTNTLNQSMQVLKWLKFLMFIPISAKLGVINSQFYRFLRLCSCKKFLVFQMVSLIVFLKEQGYNLKILLKRTRGLLIKEKFIFGISTFGTFKMILPWVL